MANDYHGNVFSMYIERRCLSNKLRLAYMVKICKLIFLLTYDLFMIIV